jgi:hypothetical protein
VRNHDGLLRGAQSVAGLGTFTIEGERLAADACRIALRRRWRAAVRPPSLHRVRAPARDGPAVPPFRAIGLDPTAGSWAARMASGPRPMPSVVLAWTGAQLRFEGCERHRDNGSFWRRAREAGARSAGIDGPCGTNGLSILPDWSGWDRSRIGGLRDAELALAATGLGLFWTSHATITRFDGASRWIARSLALFAGAAGVADAIETYPHGAFTVLWRGAGGRAALGHKATSRGRANRLALLRAHVPDLRERELRDHDAVDAAAAALVAALHRLGRTVAYGTEAGGGRIWLPVSPAPAGDARAARRRAAAPQAARRIASATRARSASGSNGFSITRPALPARNS